MCELFHGDSGESGEQSKFSRENMVGVVEAFERAEMKLILRKPQKLSKGVTIQLFEVRQLTDLCRHHADKRPRDSQVGEPEKDTNVRRNSSTECESGV